MLNLEQEKAVRHTGGPLLVLAGPGSGKTTMIVHRLEELLRRGTDPKSILVVTYTKAAAQEMRSRFLRYMGTEQSEIRFGTLHSFFWQVLSEQHQITGWRMMEGDEALRLAAEILQEESGMPEEEAVFTAEQELDRYRYERGRMLPHENTGFAGAFEERKRSRHILDYDDILTLALRLLRNDPAAVRVYRDRYRHILVDEYQDINPVQYAGLKLLAGTDGNLFAVGDDDQSIYAFRGSDPGLLLRFPGDFDGSEVLRLSANYRSTPEIVDFASAIICRNRERYAKSIHAVRPHGRFVQKRSYRDGEEEWQAIAAWAARQRHPEQCAVLYRSIYDAAGLCRTLDDRGTGYALKDGSMNPYRHWIGQDILDYAMAAQGDPEAFGRILKRPPRGIPSGILTWLRQGEDPEKLLQRPLGREYLTELEEMLYHLRRIRSERPEKGMAGIYKNLEYKRFLEQFAEEHRLPYKLLYGRWRFFRNLAHNCKDWQEYAEKLERGLEGHNDRERGGIRIMTLHASKGLEFDQVWIPQIEAGTLPHERADSLEEERRLLYVGCTRARDELILSRAKRRTGGRKKTSVFWKELPE